MEQKLKKWRVIDNCQSRAFSVVVRNNDVVVRNNDVVVRNNDVVVRNNVAVARHYDVLARHYLCNRRPKSWHMCNSFNALNFRNMS